MAIRTLKSVPTTYDHAILYDPNGKLLQTNFDPQEIEALEWLAERNQVRRFLKFKKGRKTAIFRLIEPPEPIQPSNSFHSAASLTDKDSMLLALRFHTPKLIERWIGWGLIKAKHSKFSGNAASGSKMLVSQ